MARRGHRVEPAAEQQGGRGAGQDAVERRRHRAAWPARADALVQRCLVGSEVGAGRIGGGLPGVGKAHPVFGADDGEVHPYRGRHPLGRCQQRADADQPFIAPGGRCGHGRWQGGRHRRRIQRAANGAEQHLARHLKGLGGAARRWRGGHRFRQAFQQRRPVGPQARKALLAGGVALAVLQQRVPGSLVVGRETGRQVHVGRRYGVEHAAPHGGRELALVLERGARAVGHTDQVDARHAELAAHGVEVLHRDRRREQAQVGRRVEVGQLQQGRLAGHQLLEVPVRVGLRSQRLAARVGAGEWCGAAGAALVDVDDVAPVVEPAEQRQGRGRDVDRALPRAAGQQEHRVRQLAARLRRDDDVVHVDLRTRRPGRVERALHHAAPHAVAQAGQPTVRQRRFGARRPAVSQQCRQHRQAGARCCRGVQTYSPNKRLISPLAISASSSDAPPTSEPFTNTIGKVGQPDHIFSALRSRQRPR